MAVQPDKRSREARLAENGMNLVECYRVGSFTLQAFARQPNPATYYIRHDRSMTNHLGNVTRNPHDGWVTWLDSGRHRDVGPGECLAWWVAQQR